MSSLAFLIYSPFPNYSGGRENWLYNIAPELQKLGHEVSIISYASDLPEFHHLGPAVHSVRLPSLRRHDQRFRMVNRLSLGSAKYIDAVVSFPVIARRWLRATRPPQLICMNSIPEGLSARLAGIPYSVCVRGDVPLELAGPGGILRRPLNAIEHGVLRNARRVLANGYDTCDRLAAAGIASAVIPNGVDLARFASPSAGDDVAREVDRWRKTRHVITAVGTVREIKGVRDAIACSVAMAAVRKDFVLAMVGKGDTGRYRALAEQEGVEDNVLFTGETRDVPAVLQRSELFLAVSGGGGFSMAVLEALAAGVPVVAKDSPIYRQLIKDGENGLLAGSPRDLAAACLRLIDDPELAQRLGRSGRRSAQAFSWENVARRLLEELPA